jgi:hypothetical protein
MSKYNIENYSIKELLNLFGLEEDELSESNIENILNEKYNKIKTVVENNKSSNTEQKLTYTIFLLEAKNKIIDAINNKIKNNNELLNSQWDIEKVTQFKKEWEKTSLDKIWIFDSQHRNKTALSLPPTNGPPTTDYVYQFEDEVRNVESIEMISVTIPTSWYIFDSITKKNTYFKLEHSPTDFSYVTIEDGTYDISYVISQINNTALGNDMSFVLNPQTRKIDISCNNNVVNKKIIFYDPNDPSFNQNNATSNLGNILGFRPSNVGGQLVSDASNRLVLELKLGKNMAKTSYNLNGPKLFYIYLDEYAPKTIAPVASTGSIPSNLSNSIDKSNKYYIETKTLDCCYVEVEPNFFVNLPAPNPNKNRDTINQIIAQGSKNIHHAIVKSNSLTMFDKKQLNLNEIFAIVPVINYHNLFETNRNMVFFNDVLNNNKRLYKGTTHLKNFRIKLIDEDGDIVNLNGLDWCFTVKLHINSSSSITPD